MIWSQATSTRARLILEERGVWGKPAAEIRSALILASEHGTLQSVHRMLAKRRNCGRKTIAFIFWLMSEPVPRAGHCGTCTCGALQ